MVTLAGNSAGNDIATVEIYDPATNNWTVQTPLGSARYDHTSLLLPTGQVLVAGGALTDAGATLVLGTLEIFDFSRPFWTTHAPNSFAAVSSSSTLTGTSRILLSGGSSASTRSAMFDPSSNMSSATQDSVDPHAQHSTVTLTDGRVLVVGGSSSEILNPTTNSYSSRTVLLSSRNRARAISLTDQSILLAGGDNGTCVSSAETYDVDAQVWRAINSPGAICEPTLTLLQSGQVLLSGEGRFMTFSNQTGAWTSVATNATLLRGHSAALLSDGRVFISGGRNGTSTAALSATSIFRPATNQLVTGPALGQARYNHLSQTLWSGRVLIVGDRTGGAGVRSATLFEPLNDTYVALTNAPADVADATATLSPDGRVIIFSDTSIIAFDEGRAPAAMYRPTLSALSTIEAGATLSLTGARFTGFSEGGTGTSLSSPGNVPSLMLMRQGNSALYFARTTSWTSTTAQVVIPSTLPAGMYVARLSVSGALSEGRVLQITSPTGAACGANAACSSGFCSDGVCCNSACVGQCDACSVAAGSTADGTCTVLGSVTICRASTGMCDAAETCDGVSADCPADQPPLSVCQSMDAGTDGGTDEGTDGGNPDGGAQRFKISKYHIACGCSGAWTSFPLPLALLIYLVRTSRRRLNRISNRCS